VLEELAFHDTIDLLDMTLVQGDKNRALVGKVLINRTDADTGNLGDAVCRNRFDALSLQNSDHGVEHRFDRLTSPPLLGLAAIARVRWNVVANHRSGSVKLCRDGGKDRFCNRQTVDFLYRSLKNRFGVK
jgi:hypothetical protein